MGKTRDLKKIGYTKGTFHAKMGDCPPRPPTKGHLARSDYSFDGGTAADGEKVGEEGTLLVSSG